MANLTKYKLHAGRSWNGYTPKQHLLSVMGGSDLEMAQTVEQILDVNDGYNLMSRLMSYGIDPIEQDKSEFGWHIENTSTENYNLVAGYEDRQMTRELGSASTTGTPAYKAGANQTKVYLVFENRPFEITEIIGSKRYRSQQFWIDQEPVNIGGNRTLYECQLSGSNGPDDFCPQDEFDANTIWFHVGGAVAEARSERGFGFGFQTHGAFKNRLSQFRMEYELPGNMMNQRVMPLVFQLPQVKGDLWISVVEYQWMRKIRKATASILLDGKANVWDDGTIQNVDNNGNAVPRGAGFNELFSTSNLRQWNGVPDATLLMKHILDIVISKTNQRTADIICGEYGYLALADAFAKRYGGTDKWNENPWINDGTGRAFQWKGNDIEIKTGQIVKVVDVLGITLNFVIDQSKDNMERAVEMHPLGGPVSSYEYDIVGLGGKEAKSNMKIVRRKGEAPSWAAVNGIRGMGKFGAGSMMNPNAVATSTDATTIHYFEPGIGAKVKDPTAIVRYYPVQSRLL